MIPFLFSLLFVSGVFIFKHTGNDVEWSPFFAASLLAVPVVASMFGKNTKLSVKLLFYFTTIQGLFWGLERYLTDHFDVAALFSVRIVALTTVLLNVLFVCLFLNWQKIKGPLGLGLFLGGLLHSGSLIFDQLILHAESGKVMIGLLGNRSIGATFSALWVFFVFVWSGQIDQIDFEVGRIFRWVGAIIGILAVCCSNSGISFVGLVAGFAIYFLVEMRSIVACVVLMFSAFEIAPLAAPRLFESNLRYPLWRLWLEFWYGSFVDGDYIPGHFGFLFGSGGGTAKFWGPAAQVAAKFRVDVTEMFTHNDWLQVFFEYGILGLVLVSWVYFDALKSSWNRSWLFSGLVCFGVLALGNYPLHIAATSILVWWLMAEALSEVPKLSR